MFVFGFEVVPVEEVGFDDVFDENDEVEVSLVNSKITDIDSMVNPSPSEAVSLNRYSPSGSAIDV